MKNLQTDQLVNNLKELYEYRKNYLSGDEKGEAQVFCERLFKAYGHEGIREAGATLEERLKKRDKSGTSFADLIWKPRVLIEMKKAGEDLSKHFRQAFDYWVLAVPNRPRYVVLCNFDEFWIYDFDLQIEEPVDRVTLKELHSRANSLGFLQPIEVEPVFRNNLVEVTRTAASKVAKVFKSLHDRGISREQAQRFCLQSVMTMFAEDIGLIPQDLFSRILNEAKDGVEAYDTVFGLFREMNVAGVTSGGRYKGTPYFNGGLFAKIIPFELTDEELELMRSASMERWSDVRPEIFGTLFEGSMDSGERHASGAHFTSQADILKIVIPTIVKPWQARINAAKNSTIDLQNELQALSTFKVFDPACGSGNFLYVAYRELRRLEKYANDLLIKRSKSKNIDQLAVSFISTENFMGIDKNPFAVEIAKVTMMMAKKLSSDELHDSPNVLPLDNLDNSIWPADALFTPWPEADVIIGNPPYLGSRKMVNELGAAYTDRLKSTHKEVAGVADFVCYWFPLAHKNLKPGGRVGFVATNTIRQNQSRDSSLGYITQNNGVIVEAVTSEPWSGDAGVSVSIVNWIKNGVGVEIPDNKILWINDGTERIELPFINASLSPNNDVSKAKKLVVNDKPKVTFQGQTPGVSKGFILSKSKHEDIEIYEKISKDSSKAIYPFLGGEELLHEFGPTKWVIDIAEKDQILAQKNFPSAFEYIKEQALDVKLQRANRQKKQNTERLANNPKSNTRKHHEAFLSAWWQLGYRREAMLNTIKNMDRYIAVTRVASDKRPSVFTFVDSNIRIGDSVQAFMFDDDYSMGILHSNLHYQWMIEQCSTLETRLRYTPTSVFNTFPWPQKPDPKKVEFISEIVAEIFSFREEQLINGINLATQYDSFRLPGKSKLKNLHEELDGAVLSVYGFSKNDSLMEKLLELNAEVHQQGISGRKPGNNGLTGTRKSDYMLKSNL